MEGGGGFWCVAALGQCQSPRLLPARCTAQMQCFHPTWGLGAGCALLAEIFLHPGLSVCVVRTQHQVLFLCSGACEFLLQSAPCISTSSQPQQLGLPHLGSGVRQGMREKEMGKQGGKSYLQYQVVLCSLCQVVSGHPSHLAVLILLITEPSGVRVGAHRHGVFPGVGF